MSLVPMQRTHTHGGGADLGVAGGLAEQLMLAHDPTGARVLSGGEGLGRSAACGALSRTHAGEEWGRALFAVHSYVPAWG